MERIAFGDRCVEHAIVELDAGAVGDTDEPVEDSDDRRSLDRSLVTDHGGQCSACLVDVTATEFDRVGESEEFRSRRNTDFANVFGIEGTLEVDSQTVRFAAHTEQRGVGRRSIEALVERRRTGRHEFGLWTRQRELPPQVRELGAVGVVRVDQLEPRPIGDGHEAECSAHV